MRLCSYVVTVDRGLAPNPFWEYCTIAVCTPNHMGVKLKKGDWLIGTTSVVRGNKLLYAMQVSEMLCFDDYYRDARFEKKKPNVKGSWKERCGDNMYYIDNGEWKQHHTIYHRDASTRKKDLSHPYVFVAEHFYYFGENAIELPPEYKELIRRRRGCKCKHDPATVNGFLDWLQRSRTTGASGEPYDRDKSECDDCNKYF